MKLRNKKTGEIITKIDVSQDNESIWIMDIPKIYRSLAELNADWEDYEENKVQIKIEKRPIEERLLNLEIKMADAEDDIAMLKDKIAELCRRMNDLHP